MPDLPANSPPAAPTAPPQPPAPIVLDYQRAEKAKRIATGGLLIMGVTLTTIPILLSALVMLEGRHTGIHARRDLLLIAAIAAFPFVWGSAYIITALLIRRGIRWAGWLALALTSIQVAGWLILASLSTLELINNHYESLGLKALLFGLFLIVTVGFTALVLEVWIALRAPQLWRS